MRGLGRMSVRERARERERERERGEKASVFGYGMMSSGSDAGRTVKSSPNGVVN